MKFPTIALVATLLFALPAWADSNLLAGPDT
jgi:hypothetical protein